MTIAPVRRRFAFLRRRVSVFFAALIVVGFVVWFVRGPSLAFNLLASRSLSQRDLQSAEAWLRWSTRCSASYADTELLWARLSRRLREGEAMVTHLRQARKLGADVNDVRREEQLARAQSGEIKPIQQELNAMLIDQRGDGQEICEAMVNGLIINNQLDEAFVILDAWRLSFPNDGHPDYVTGRIAEYQDRNIEGEAAYRAALALEPNHRPALYRLGRLLLRTWRLDEALALFQRLGSLHVGAAAVMGEAEARLKMGNGIEAGHLLRPLLLLSRSDFNRSLVLVDELIEETSVELELSTVESQLGNHAEALRLLEIVLAQEPNNLTARYAHAIELRENNRNAESAQALAAVATSRKLLAEVDVLIDTIQSSKDQGHSEEKLRVGELYMQHGSRKTGEFWLKQALLANPRCTKAHELLAEYYAANAKTRPEFEKLAERHRRSAAQSR